MSNLVVFKLQVALGILLQHDKIESCEVDTGSVSAHFTVEAEAGAKLVERIYAAGGLRWCSRHALGLGQA